MRKLGFGIGALVLAAAFVGGCSKNSECCGDKECKDKAAVKMESDAAPAGGEKKCCSGDKAAASGCCQGKKGQ
jgi:hypothetical protein